MERGPVEEVLIDNGVSFCSEVLRELCEKWGVKQYFRSTYCQSGNGIIEISPQEAAFWYHMAPKNGQDETSVPHKSIFTYKWRFLLARTGGGEQRHAKIAVGEKVWVKPHIVHCTMRWGRGKVTEVLSQNKVAVDGVPQHVLDIWRVSLPSDEVAEVPPEEHTLGWQITKPIFDR